MGLISPIEWTESTWNPVTGCTKISLGCRHCYAERMARRLKAMASPATATASSLRSIPRCLQRPYPGAGRR